MPPKKKAAAAPKRIIVAKTESTRISDLSTHHKNPRHGDIGLIAESLETHGQFRPILVNIGTKTKRPYEIAAGNHTYLAARQLGWDQILASFIDVDEKTLTKIVLADNKTADAGTYDDKVLAELFATLDSFSGTGYNEMEINDIMAEVERDAQRAMEAMSSSTSDLDLDNFLPDSIPTSEPVSKHTPRFEVDEDDEDAAEADFERGAARPDYTVRDVEDVQQDPNQKSQAQLQAELQAILELREDETYMGDNFFQIPDLREDMLMDEFPKDIITWAGAEATPDDGKRWYFYNYGLGGTKGLPLDRSVLAFNTHDDKFLSWWENPAYYVSKMIAGGLRYAVVPDFSFYYTSPRVVHLQSVHRAQWLGRFMQEAGIKIIPRVQFSDEDSFRFNLSGIPKNPPYFECSIQNTRDDFGTKEESEAQQAKLLQRAIDAIEPTKGVIVYGGNPGRRVLESVNTRGAEPIWVENYAAVRRGTVFDKKDGLASLSAKEKKEIREKAVAKEEARTGKKLRKTSEVQESEDDDE